MRNSADVRFDAEKLEWRDYPTVKKFDDMFSRFDVIPACDGRTDGKTSCASRGKNRASLIQRSLQYTAQSTRRTSSCLLVAMVRSTKITFG